LPRVYMADSDCGKVGGDNWSEFGEKIVSRWRAMIQDAAFTPMYYRPKAGTVLIWHENLMHAGSKRADATLSRRSVVSHVFADGAISFYDSTGIPGTMVTTEELSQDLSNI
jgi:hypothetical protein